MLTALLLPAGAAAQQVPEAGAAPEPAGGFEYIGPFSWSNPMERFGRVDRRAMRRVDQGFEDIDPLGTSLRHLDSRAVVSQPVGFSDLYESSDGTLYRFDGGIGASFNQSDYVLVPVNRYEAVVMPAVPAGTVYHIGLSPDDLEATEERWRATASSRDAHRAPAARPGRGPSAIAPAARATLETTVIDDGYRRDRVAELLRSVRPEN